jgi:TRAP-type mannitol/chloroaromatic compound transport system permease small subunit
MIHSVIRHIDQLNKAVGHAFAWCIVILILGISFEVFMRYALNAPTSWAFDFSFILYGSLFLMSGAYTLSRGGHVRADIFYRRWKPRTQASLEMFLYFIFYFPGVLALVFAGWSYGSEAMRIREVSVNSPVGVPIWPLKMLIPVAGVLLTLQGIAEVLRCVLCLKTGEWPARLHDVEEMEDALQHSPEAAAAAAGIAALAIPPASNQNNNSGARS